MARKHPLRPIFCGPGFAQIRLYLLVIDIFPEAVGTQEKGTSRRDCSSTALWLAAFFSQYTQEAGAIVVMVDIHIGDLTALKLLVSDGVVPR